MERFGKAFAATLLIAVFGMHSGMAQAQCPPGRPGCDAPPPRTSGTQSGGGSVGVQIDVGDAAKAIGGIFKKKKKKEVAADVATAPVEQPKQEVVFVRSDPVVQVLPGTKRKVRDKTAAVVKPVVRKPVERKIATPVAAERPAPEPVPVAKIASPEAPAAKAATIAPINDAPKADNSLYWIIAAAVAALAAAATAAKFLLPPKIAMDCNIADGTSRMISNPSLTKPEVDFNVAIPGFSASSPANFAIIA